MKKSLQRIIQNRLFPQNILAQYENVSYSQTGEDLIMYYIFKQLGISKPTYLDLGAHHPHYLSNTYFFYKKGSSGVNVEPDPFLIKEFNEHRERDINLNVGIGFSAEKIKADFFIMSAKVMNTFSREEALRVQAFGSHRIEEIIEVSLITVNEVIKSNFNGVSPNLVSIDVEGLDFEIIKTFDFELYCPEVFCIETLTYSEDKSERKLQEIIDYMINKGYFVYADTYLNTIFVNKKIWTSR